MSKFYSAAQCRSKADQHWEMAGLARQDGDKIEESRHTEEARTWDCRAAEGGWQKGES